MFIRLLFERRAATRWKNQLLRAFPTECGEDVAVVARILSPRKSCDCKYFFYRNASVDWVLLSGERICMPYRVCVREWPRRSETLTPRQRLILCCVLSRSCNGYLRQEAVERLLAEPMPHWALPYVVKLCDEYVVEILRVIYEGLTPSDRDRCRCLCAKNLQYIRLAHSRMISYWNEFYRRDCYRYREYIGKRLFAECFGYRKTGQQVIDADGR